MASGYDYAKIELSIHVKAYYLRLYKMYLKLAKNINILNIKVKNFKQRNVAVLLPQINKKNVVLILE